MRADRSGPLRAGSIVEIEPPRQVIDCPALAIITRFMAKRPAWERNEPFQVPDNLYATAEKEMRNRMKTRGFPIPTSPDLTRDGIKNFMLLGTPIISKDE